MITNTTYKGNYRLTFIWRIVYYYIMSNLEDITRKKLEAEEKHLSSTLNMLDNERHVISNKLDEVRRKITETPKDGVERFILEHLRQCLPTIRIEDRRTARTPGDCIYALSYNMEEARNHDEVFDWTFTRTLLDNKLYVSEVTSDRIYVNKLE